MDKIRNAKDFLVRHHEFILGYVAGAFVVPLVAQKLRSVSLPVKVEANASIDTGTTE